MVRRGRKTVAQPICHLISPHHNRVLTPRVEPRSSTRNATVWKCSSAFPSVFLPVQMQFANMSHRIGEYKAVQPLGMRISDAFFSLVFWDLYYLVFPFQVSTLASYSPPDLNKNITDIFKKLIDIYRGKVN